jgi:hypothetical protein
MSCKQKDSKIPSRTIIGLVDSDISTTTIMLKWVNYLIVRYLRYFNKIPYFGNLRSSSSFFFNIWKCPKKVFQDTFLPSFEYCSYFINPLINWNSISCIIIIICEYMITRCCSILLLPFLSSKDVICSSSHMFQLSQTLV